MIVILKASTRPLLVSGRDAIGKKVNELPYGPAVISSHLKKNNFPVKLVNLQKDVDERITDKISFLDLSDWIENDILSESMDSYLEECLKKLPNLSEIKLVGISVLSQTEYVYSLAIAKRIKHLNPSIVICFGGPCITVVDLELPVYVDFFVKGMGQIPIKHIADHIYNNVALSSNILGLYFRNGDQVIGNGVNVESLDNECLPDYTDFNLNEYLNDNPKGKYGLEEKVLSINYRLSSGCANRCSFCSFRTIDSLSYKSLNKIYEDLCELKKLHENIYIKFNDNAVNSNKKYFSKVLDMMIEKKLDIKWSAMAIINNTDEDLLNKLKKAGCKRIYYGIEHFSDDMQKIFNKKISNKHINYIIDLSDRMGIESDMALILNGPNEQIKDIRLLEKRVKEYLKYPSVQFNFNQFRLHENVIMYNDPGKYKLDILSKPEYNLKKFFYYGGVKWKDNDVTMESFQKRLKRHERIFYHLKELNNAVVHLRLLNIHLPISIIAILCKVRSKIRQIRKTVRFILGLEKSITRKYTDNPQISPC